MVEPCPCGSKIAFNACCDPYIHGTFTAPTPLSLMRSRYSAYVHKNVEYLMATWHPDFRHPDLAAAISESFNNTQWLGLTIVDAGEETPERGYVEFVARFIDTQTQRPHAIYERSTFIRRDDVWYYTQGVKPRIGRNDACPCGSNKKYKKCCGND